MWPFRKKSSDGKSLRNPIWKIIFTVFLSMFLLSAYFIIYSRIKLIESYFENYQSKSDAVLEIISLRLDGDEISKLIKEFEVDSTNRNLVFKSPTFLSFKNRFESSTTNISRLFEKFDKEKFKKDYPAEVIVYDSLNNSFKRLISFDDSSSFGRIVNFDQDQSQQIKKYFKPKKGDFIVFATKNESTGEGGINFSSAPLIKPIRDSNGKVIAIVNLNIPLYLMVDDIKAIFSDNIRISFYIFLITFLIIYFFVRKILKREHNIKLELINNRKLIELKNKDITDSINYAKRIQEALLPSRIQLKSKFSELLLMYLPKDVVSGDFYFSSEKDNIHIIAAVDCTGHGVPGAFMSMIGHDQLSHIITEKGITTPSEILKELNRGIKKSLKQADDSTQARDGMDISLCSIDFSSNKLQFAGANRPLFLFQNGNFTEVKGTKASIGGFTNDNQEFALHEFTISEKDTFYLFSDGYVDQFGGTQQKKFKVKQFKEILQNSQEKPLKEQEELLKRAFGQWKGTLEQVDDVLVIGFKI